MKIIGVDNLARDHVSEKLWLDEIPDDQEPLVKRICDKLNEHLGNHSGTYYKPAPDSHVLYKFEGY